MRAIQVLVLAVVAGFAFSAAARPPPPPPPLPPPAPAPQPAVAEPPPPPPAPASQPAPQQPSSQPKWNAGAGVRFGTSLTIAGGGGTGGLSISSLTAPTALVSLEHKLGDRTWLQFQGVIAYSVASPSGGGDGVHVTNLQANIGPRYVLNPGGIVEVSLFAVAGFAYINTDIEGGAVTVSSDGTIVSIPSGHTWSVGVNGGITLERELIDRLALRFSTGIVNASYFNTSDTDHGFDLGLRFNPSIELRLAF